MLGTCTSATYRLYNVIEESQHMRVDKAENSSSHVIKFMQENSGSLAPSPISIPCFSTLKSLGVLQEGMVNYVM